MSVWPILTTVTKRSVLLDICTKTRFFLPSAVARLYTDRQYIVYIKSTENASRCELALSLFGSCQDAGWQCQYGRYTYYEAAYRLRGSIVTGWTGSRMVKVLPVPVRVSIQMRPPWASTRTLTIGSPTPGSPRPGTLGLSER